MAFAVDTSDRQVIPRLRGSVSGLRSGEIAPFRTGAAMAPPEQDDALFELRLSEWKATRALPFAADLLGVSVVVRREAEAADAAEFVLGADASSGPLTAIAKRVLGLAGSPDSAGSTPKTVESEAWRRIAVLRTRVRAYPRNGLAWLDLAEAHATLGHLDSSDHAMRVALALLPDHRLVLRSASHFYVHVGEADRALWLLRRSDAAKEDPWLAAAEIAVSSVAGKSSSLMTIGRKMAVSGRYDDFHLSELRSAVGTATSRAGDRKRARRLLEDSLMSPTDNAVAQIEWMAKNRELTLGDLTSTELQVSTEGQAFDAYRRREWSRAFEASMEWFAEQPLSPLPPAFACHMAVLLDDGFPDVLQMLDLSLKGNPDSWIILNDVAFTSIVLGNLQRASDMLMGMPSESGDRHRDGVIAATKGLLAMREGKVVEGRALYRRSLETLGSPKLKPVKAAAAAFWAREEARIHSDMSEEALGLARKLAEQVHAVDLPILHDQAEALSRQG